MPDALAQVLREDRTWEVDTPTAELNAALIAERAGDVSGARQRMEALRLRLPEWGEVPLRLAESYRRAGETTSAIAAYEKTLELEPRRAEALLGLGALRLGRGELAMAQALFLRCCGAAPDRAEVWDALGSSLLLGGEAAAAEAALAQAQLLDPGNIDVALRRAEAAFAAGGGAAELARLELAAAADPANCSVLTPLGVLRERAGQRDEAIDALTLATALAPDHAAAHGLLALMLVRANRLPEALAALDQAIVLSPENLTLRNNRAATLLRLHRYGEARETLAALVEEHGDHGGVLNNLSNALVSLGEQDAGLAVALRAVAHEPETPLAWRTLCNALPYCEGIGGLELSGALRRAGSALPRGPAPAWTNERDPARRLRVGLLSNTLKTHPVGWLTAAGFENLDPRSFELHAIGADHGSDMLHRRFRAVTASWTLPDGGEGLVDTIRGLGLDIVIDLGGYGDLGMMALCARRLAPVQIKWVGAQNHSTGLDEIDWFLTDPHETPEEFERFYSERLLRLPDGYVCYSPAPYAPDVGPLPACRNRYVTFGCFNNLAKITRGTIAAWAAILASVPRSRLVVKNHQMGDAATAERFRARFAAHGVDPARLDLRGGSPHRMLLAQYNDIDIVLDPFPYAGGLTTCEALWMGVPVLTLPGEIFASRHSASHLGNVGLAGWIAPDLESYCAMAIKRAAALPALAALRAGLRARMKASPLCDGPRFGRNLGAALRTAWRAWCEGR
jgi:predicted O-linked N-acetylglucosamine transferase (SPINDLY family)